MVYDSVFTEVPQTVTCHSQGYKNISNFILYKIGICYISVFICNCGDLTLIIVTNKKYSAIFNLIKRRQVSSQC